MNYEDKMKMLANCKPEYKDILLMKILKGEVVDITKDADLFYQINKDRVSMDEFTNRDKFKASAEDMKRMKSMIDPNHKSKKGMKLIGEIPPEIYFSRPEFSPDLPKEERDRNIRKWLNTYNVFKISDKTL